VRAGPRQGIADCSFDILGDANTGQMLYRCERLGTANVVSVQAGEHPAGSRVLVGNWRCPRGRWRELLHTALPAARARAGKLAETPSA
jgi:hypothetical protein